MAKDAFEITLIYGFSRRQLEAYYLGSKRENHTMYYF